MILTRAGARFNNYCSTLPAPSSSTPARTWKRPTALTDVFKACLRVLRHGQRINVYKLPWAS